MGGYTFIIRTKYYLQVSWISLILRKMGRHKNPTTLGCWDHLNCLKIWKLQWAPAAGV